jgi:predicted nucleic acid-binding protein
MTFGDVLAGQLFFVDANTFVYALAPEPILGPPCYQLLERIRRKEIEGFTSAHVLSDVAHRLMSLEACATFTWPYAGIANRLKRHLAEVAKLHTFRQALDQIVAIGIHILPVTAQNVLSAGDLSRRHGTLTGDGLILAVMQSQGLTMLASNDGDFDPVPGITRYSPL